MRLALLERRSAERSGQAVVRIASLLPSATEIVCALGLGDELVGRTSSCDVPVEVGDVPVLTRPGGAGPGIGARGDLRHELHGGTPTSELDVEALVGVQPDLVLAADLCDTCGMSRTNIVRTLRATGSDAEVVALDPRSIEGILNSITTIGAMTSAEDEAIGLVEILRERLGRIEEQVHRRRDAGVQPRRVVALEWLDPPFASGDWVPEQVRRAGGWDLLGREGERARPASWSAIVDVDPEQILLVPCGLDAAATAATWARVEKPADWSGLRAVRHGEVFALDARYFTRPGPRVIDGIALLAELFDPQGFVDEAPGDAWIPLAG